MNILMVALGGALGAVCRYGISKVPLEANFPIATFITNLIGAFVIGFIVGISEKNNVSERIVLFLKTGFCGGFTTFSTFSLEAMTLLNDGKYLFSGAYMALSLILCVAGVAFGQQCARQII